MNVNELLSMKAMKRMEALRSMNVDELQVLSDETSKLIKQTKDLEQLTALRNLASRITGEMAALKFG